ncbi:MAG: DUF2087 domain-containing protein [Oscillospiraceae bacterium]|nr:DUF2087 domain-containing protein [Oscillospiraceae bacterium]
MNQIKIGKFIAERRKEHGFLQKDIAARLGISEKTVSKWECGNGLPEVVYMEPLCRILGITVNELLAGESIPILELMSLIDMSRLELVKQLEFEQLRMRIYKLYDIEIQTMETSENGAGGLTYFVTAGDNKYVVKYPTDNEINHPEMEIKVCEMLLTKGIPACRFSSNKHGKMLSTDENGRRFTVQHFYEGITYDYNEASENMQKASAVLLAKVHKAMKDMENIPIGIGSDFLAHRKPEYMKNSYIDTLQQAINNGDNDIANAIRSNMRIVESMPAYEFDINKFSCGNTHGDYMISQLIWLDDKINGIVDWTCACKHPYVWEIVRSYVFMAPEVKQGEINIEALIRYIAEYMEYNPLNTYDIENAGKLFYYFLAVCNFYGQYYDSISKNRYIYLKQADMSSRLLAWFEKHIDELNEKLCNLSMQITNSKKVSVFYDSKGRLKQYPRKNSLRIIALAKIADCFEKDRKYTEKEVNEIILQNISFSDYATIRREMFQQKLINRLSDGSEYWRES